MRIVELCLLCCDKELLSITELFGEADNVLFNRTLTNTRHVLQTYLPDQTETADNLRNCTHSKSLINKTLHLNEKDLLYECFTETLVSYSFLDFLIFCFIIFYLFLIHTSIYFAYVICCLSCACQLC